MRPLLWAGVLQYSRLGIGAVMFLIAARYLSLLQIGAFAAALAPVRLLAVVHRPGIVDAILATRFSSSLQNQMLMISFGLGVLISACLVVIGMHLPDPIGQMLQVLAVLPLLHGLGSPSEARLRGDMRIKALALRSLFAQTLAAALALWLLYRGAGAWALVSFAMINAILGTALALWLAPVWPSSLPKWAELKQVIAPVWRIAARELASGATLPLLQILVTAALGLGAGGAFQIAARLMSLIDTLAVAPIRYIALPRFARAAQRASLPKSVLRSLQQTSIIACLIYPGAILAAPELLTLTVGPAHVAATLPLIPAFCLFGLGSALVMPLTQGLTAVNQTRVPLLRSLATLVFILILALVAVSRSLELTAAALPIGSGLILLPYGHIALKHLGLSANDALLAIVPPMLIGFVTAVVLIIAIPPLSPIASLTTKVLFGTALYAALLLFIGWCQRQRLTA